MSYDVDNRVVQMEFDNKEFEKGIQTSINSLNKLEKGLELKGATKGLEEVNTAAKGLNMSGVSSAVETVSSKFSALQVMAVTALANITNSAVNAGKRIVSSLTIDPIKTGFSEYETQINAVQTILANTESKGTTLADVNKALDELNAYADKTIYNFTEMTRNIGTFTAAGTDLDTSVKAIQGIANLAAVSGSTSQQASTAMYQLSQALSSGTVKLQDWNSVTNAGMGGQVFQDALKETARVHGIAIDDMIDKQGSFRETLKDGWLTSEILTETLEKFTLTTEGLTEAQIKENREMLKGKGYTDEQIDAIFKLGNTATDAATKVKTFTQLFDTLKEAAQSGWTQSWEIIVGDFEEAKVLLTEVSNVIGDMINASSEARNEMLRGWKELGGRTVLIDGVKNAFEGVMNVVAPIKDALREIFPPLTAKKLYSITEGFKSLTAKFKELSKSTDFIDKIKRTFKGIFATLDIGVMLFKAITNGLIRFIKYMAPAGNGLLGFTAKLGDLIVRFRDFLKSGDVFNKAVDKIATGLKFAVDKVKSFVSKVAEAFRALGNVDTSGLDKLSDRVKERFKPFAILGEGIKKIFLAIGAVLVKTMPIFAALASAVGKAFGAVSDAIMGAISEGGISGVLDLFNSGAFAAVLIAIKKFLGSLTGITDGAGDTFKGFSDILGGVKETLGGVKGILESYQQSIKANVILKIAAALAILAVSLIALSLIDSDRLNTSLAAMTAMFVELFGSMAIFEKIMGSAGFKGMTKVTTAMVGLSIAVLILSVAMTKLAKLDWDGIVKGLAGVAGLCVMLVASAKVLSTSSGKLIKGSTGLVIFAAAILILSTAVAKIGALDFKTIAKGISGIGAIMGVLIGFIKATGGAKKVTSTAIGMTILGAAMLIFAKAIGNMGNLSWGQIGKGLLTMASALGVIIGAMHALPKNMTSKGVALVVIASALLILGEAVGKMGSLNWQQIAKGLVAMAGALGLIVGAMYALPKNMAAKGAALTIIATALLIVGKAVTSMGNLSWGQIGKGLLTMAGALGAIVAVMYALPADILAKSVALMAIAASLLVLGGAMSVLGSMSLSEVGTGLLAIAGIFIILGAAGAVLGGLTGPILALSAAVALLGVGIAAIGVGVLAFATGLGALAAAGSGAAAALVVIVTSIISLIPMFLEQVAKGILAFAKIIGQGGPAICEAIAAVLLAIIGALKECIPPLFECLGIILTELLNFLKTYIGPILECLGVVLDAVLQFLVASIPKWVDAGMKMLIGLLQGIADNIAAVIEAGTNVVVQFIKGVAESVPRLIQAGYDLILSFINGMADAIRNNAGPMADAFSNLGDAMIDGLITGLKSGIKNIGKTIKEVGSAALNGIKDFLGIHSPSRKFKEVGKYSIEGFVGGIKDKVGAVGSAITNVAKNAVSNISNKVTSFKNSGVKVMTSAVSGMKSKLSSAKSAAASVVNGAVDSIKNKVSSFKTVGSNVISGFISGLKSKISSVATSAANMAKSALNAAKRALGINSPSKEFQEVGMYSNEGFAAGLTKFAGAVKSSAAGVGETALASLKSTMGNISDVINGEVNASPSIRPVLDLSNIRAGSNQIAGMFGQQNAILAGATIGVSSADMNNLASIAAKMQGFTGSDNSDIVDAISVLRGDVGLLAEAMSKLQIIMDSGTVVGELIGKIDSGLGQISKHKGRGN